MTSDLDRIAEKLEQELWNGYSEAVIDHARNPRNVGNLWDADGIASITGPCGDTMEIWIKTHEGILKEATFWTDGCGTTIASGSMVTELAKGRSLPEASNISQQEVLDALGGLPEESVHCALLAANTLKAAIKAALDH